MLKAYIYWRRALLKMVRDFRHKEVVSENISKFPDIMGWHEERRLGFFRDVAGYLSNNRINGVYAEFGCFTAMTFRFALNTIGNPKITANKIHRFYAFDSFRGLPKIEGIDIHSAWQEGNLKLNIEDFKNKCIKDLDRITVVPGFFSESLPRCEWNDADIAMAYVDCDLYSSARDVLKFLTGKMAHGAILAFDDYYCFYGDPERGEQKAFAEWQECIKEYSFVPFLRYGWFGMSFIVHHKARLGKDS